jgi:hypothetical protein
MKRFASAVSIAICLSALISAIPFNSFAQSPSGEFFDYITITTASGVRHFIVFKNGDVYLRENSSSDNSWAQNPSVQFLGNFWGSLPVRTDMIGYQIVDNSDSYYFQHYLLLSDGDVYMIRTTMAQPSHFGSHPYYMGNFWDGAVATDKPTWSGIKELFTK